MSRYSGRLPRTYDEGLAMLNGKTERKVPGVGNTTIRREDDGGLSVVIVRYYSTDIAFFFDDGDRTFTTGGYNTTSTRARLNAMSPVGYGFVQRDYSDVIVTPGHVGSEGRTVMVFSDGDHKIA